ncbi:translation initiation factor IF-2-like [Hylaeus volcanicus]|uniref:translation initiation factor IF-2-like n=1 Tax=Hylaeus volcanicus TaxID=313075 RepID=UPI0023B82F51|nr:translation initiation factor IF-2-like [Hylaeus volcanicus]XP_053984554.1 translation initiation factor IF-2-like [Hylaeus volcanicus]
MRKIVLLLCICLAQGGQSKKQTRDQQAAGYEYEYTRQEPELGLADSLAYGNPGPALAAGPIGHGREPPRPGFSVGGPLASIAKGAADEAHTQLSNQQTAAGQAAYVAKNTLAQAASQSAATAAAALAGKQIVVQGLEQQSRDAHVAVDGENLQLQQAVRAASAARTTAKQAMHQLQVITAALNAAQTTVDRASQAAAEAAAELAAQTTMLGQAKARAESVDEQLTSARLDYETTQSAAQKAANAAAAAQNNAAAAAAQVADTAGASALLSHAPVEVQQSVKLPEDSPLRQLPATAHNEPSGLFSAAALSEADGLRDSGGYLATSAFNDPSGLLAAGALSEAAGLRGSHGLREQALLGPGGHQEVAAYRGPTGPSGLSRSELLSLANALPVDNYDPKGYRY